MSIFTQDLSANPQLQRTNLTELEDQRFSIHEKVGRKGLGPHMYMGYVHINLIYFIISKRPTWHLQHHT
jgi:hypothetical protein